MDSSRAEISRRRLGLALRLASLALVPAWFWAAWKQGFINLVMGNQTAGFTYAGLFILYLCVKPSWREIGAVALAALAIRVLTWNSAPLVNDFPLARAAHFGGLLGLASVGALIAKAAIGNARREALTMLVRLLIFIVLGLTVGEIVQIAARLRPLKLDAYLYALDRAYGLPSFVAGRWLLYQPHLFQFERLIYFSLPLAVALLYAAHLRRPQGIDILLLLYLNGLIGFSLYLVYPACGPLYVFPSGFPLSPPAVNLAPLAIDCHPNAMPSLHAAAALLVWWNLRPFGWIARTLSALYFALTGLAILGLGEHYLIDLVVAIPYSLALQALVANTGKRLVAGAVGVTGLIGWLALLRYQVPALAQWPWTVCALTAATVAMCVWSGRLLDGRLSPAAAPREESGTDSKSPAPHTSS